MAYWGILLAVLLSFAGNDLKETSEQQLKNEQYAYIIYYEFIGKVNKEDSTKLVTERMILLSGQNTSKYLSYNKFLADSMLMDQYKNPKMINGAPSFSMQGIPRAKVNHQVSKDFSNNTYKFNNVLGVNYYVFSDSLPDLQWKLDAEEKVLLGYKCQKATTRFAGRDYIAWFTSGIPIQDGPYKFSGLPGLILEIADTKGDYKFIAVGLEKANKNIATRPISNILKELKSSSDYKAVYKKFKANPGPFFEPDNMKLPPELIEKAAKNATEMLQLQNNPLELDE
ncbi:GLPGLI family protein [Terrimonas rubra]|uniref:GLPGLI family protein n=1 Tax=Terrimonas rubra TaxID=1035890 RepID=A0ABW6A1X8_9BACT